MSYQPDNTGSIDIIWEIG